MNLTKKNLMIVRTTNLSMQGKNPMDPIIRFRKVLGGYSFLRKGIGGDYLSYENKVSTNYQVDKKVGGKEGSQRPTKANPQRAGLLLLRHAWVRVNPYNLPTI